MARVRNPTTFAKQFCVSPTRLRNLGAFNPTLAIDSKLFIDPLLLSSSSHRHFSEDAATAYKRHFERIVSLLVASRVEGDTAWRNAERLLAFSEVPGTCLGYSATSIYGHGFGPALRQRLIRTASEIVALGVRDPDLFLVLALLEDDVGPDLISDMVTNVILDPLLAFNQEVLASLQVPVRDFRFLGRNARLPTNPYYPRHTPVILVPSDILRHLPIAIDIESALDAAAESASIRADVNAHIGRIWERKVRKDKQKLRALALSSPEAFKALLDMIHAVDGKPYDVDQDPKGLVSWATEAERLTHSYPLDLSATDPTSLEGTTKIVAAIIDQFKFLIEHCGLSKSLWHDAEALHEHYAQRLFFAIAHSYCVANDLDLSPEVDTGTGKIDFKVSRGHSRRVLVEIKLSKNTKVVPGYTAQLEVYKRAQATMRAFYVVIDLGRFEARRQQLIQLRNDAAASRQPLSELVFVNGVVPPSASKR
jgi:hypothetical protein